MTDHPAHPDFAADAVTDLDVRDDLRAGREPLPRILAAAHGLASGGVLHLRTTFLPAPLLTLLGRHGYHNHSEQYAPDDWSTWFWQGELTPPSADDNAEADADADALDANTDAVDLRMYPPPQPLTYVLERVEVDPEAFDVLLPFFPAPLVRLLEPLGRQVELVAEGSDGVHVRITSRRSSTG